ncbi:MAG: NAD(P) transhydrogenase subunit alpha [Planctomycetota bacterium]
MPLKIAVPKETHAGERRVALIPQVVQDLVKDGREVTVQRGAGVAAGFPDAEYEARGARLVDDRAQLFASADVVLQVRALGANPGSGADDLALMRSGQVLVASCAPLDHPGPLGDAAARGVTVFALELVPRTTRAQSMDVLSSMATLAGYKAVLLGAGALPRILPMMMTAAGTLAAARCFVLGAGVAGLQAMATAKRLGAVVEGYDIRPVVKDQVISVGARFVELALDTAAAEGAGGYAKEQGEDFLRKQRELLTGVIAKSDLVITTAAIPGRPSPELVTEDMVKAMQPGSVLIDLAAERGGNCRLTRAGETIDAHGVTIMGPLDLPSTVPSDASRMLARNALAFLRNAYKKGADALDIADDIVQGTMAVHAGEVTNARVRESLGLPPPVSA